MYLFVFRKRLINTVYDFCGNEHAQKWNQQSHQEQSRKKASSPHSMHVNKWGYKSHRSPSFAMLIHQSVFRTLASGNLITSDLGWQEAGLTDNTNSFITGERRSCAAVDPLSLSDLVIVAAGVTLSQTLKLSSGIMPLSRAGYVDAVRKAVTALMIGSLCEIWTLFFPLPSSKWL